eukprot:Amastigsp_a841418_285.p2 type:complete len:194 gc:universal Amastigsp_a841418_285:1103-522(-)
MVPVSWAEALTRALAAAAGLVFSNGGYFERITVGLCRTPAGFDEGETVPGLSGPESAAILAEVNTQLRYALWIPWLSLGAALLIGIVGLAVRRPVIILGSGFVLAVGIAGGYFKFAENFRRVIRRLNTTTAALQQRGLFLVACEGPQGPQPQGHRFVGGAFPTIEVRQYETGAAPGVYVAQPVGAPPPYHATA